MRIALAQVSQESNTFSRERTEVTDFQRSSLLFGPEVLEPGAGDGIIDGVRAFFADKDDVQLVPILCANTTPGGKLSGEAARFLAGKLMDGARAALGAGIPILVILDHHANLTRLMIESADLVAGFETQPHDFRAAGIKGARTLYHLIRRRVRIARAWVKVPMIAPQDRFLTSAGPMKQWFDHARELEGETGILSISLFPMQPWIDVREGGWGVVAYAEDDNAIAREAVKALADQAWQLRKEFWVSERVPPEDAVRQAAAEPQGLVLISDMGDAVYAGGPGDSACILGQLWAQQVPVLSFVPIVDPSAVKEAFGRGLGPIELSLGGKTDPFSRPVAVSGRIAALSQGLKIVTDKGQTDLGRTALVEAGNLRVVLLENRSFTMIQPLIFTHLGLEMEMARIVVTKTGSNFQFFDRWRRKLIRADSQGVTQSDLKGLTWRNLPRPIFPLDNLDDWAAEPQIRE